MSLCPALWLRTGEEPPEHCACSPPAPRHTRPSGAAHLVCIKVVLPLPIPGGRPLERLPKLQRHVGLLELGGGETVYAVGHHLWGAGQGREEGRERVGWVAAGKRWQRVCMFCIREGRQVGSGVGKCLLGSPPGTTGSIWSKTSLRRWCTQAQLPSKQTQSSSCPTARPPIHPPARQRSAPGGHTCHRSPGQSAAACPRAAPPARPCARQCACCRSSLGWRRGGARAPAVSQRSEPPGHASTSAECRVQWLLWAVCTLGHPAWWRRAVGRPDQCGAGADAGREVGRGAAGCCTEAQVCRALC